VAVTHSVHRTHTNGRPIHETKRPGSDAAHVEALLDQWVARLEHAAGPRPSAASRPRARATSSPPASPTGPEVPDLERQRAASVRGALEKVTRAGSTVVFGDEAGGEVVLARVADRTVHRGTVAVRGPLGITTAALQEQGLTEPQARAFEFVASWFGGPFDAMSASRTAAARSLDWGFWPLSGSEIPRAMLAWKTRDAKSYGAKIAAYGIDVAPTDDLRGPVLEIVDPRGKVIRGERALDALTADVRRLAVLARAGRDDAASAAQIERAIASVARPMLRVPVSRGETRATLGDVVASARGVAALLCAARGIGATAFEELVRVAIADAPNGSNEESLVEAVARYLRVSGHAAIAADVRRTLSSPELRP
jgi:hypothetical protein